MEWAVQTMKAYKSPLTDQIYRGSTSFLGPKLGQNSKTRIPQEFPCFLYKFLYHLYILKKTDPDNEIFSPCHQLYCVCRALQYSIPDFTWKFNFVYDNIIE